MRYFGYSTGAIAKGDFATALDCLRSAQVKAVEFSALRLSELPMMLDYLLSRPTDEFAFKHCSFHVPSRFDPTEEPAVFAATARLVAKHAWPVIIHPDAITRWDLWRQLGSHILVENMDQRKSVGRTADELDTIFAQLPEAGLCLDLGHLRQMDPTMVEAYRIIRRHEPKIRQIHLSEVDSGSKHHPLNIPALACFIRIAPLLPRRAAVILESPVPCEEVRNQLLMAQILFAAADAHRWKNVQTVAEARHESFASEIGLTVNGTPLRLRSSESDSQMLQLFGSIRQMRESSEPAAWQYFRRVFFPAAGLEGAVLGEAEPTPPSRAPFAAEV